MPRHPSGPLIPEAFYRRPVEEVARGLLGRHLVREGVTLRITEVEAYGGPEDSASHCRFGRTPRNAPMWGPGGRAYLYFCYGVHWMLNVVTGIEGEGAAVLIRAGEVLAGWEAVLDRRGSQRVHPDLVAGPGKVAQALALGCDFNQHPLFRSRGLELREGDPALLVLAGSRVGIGFAAERDRLLPWRFAAGDSWAVSRPRLGPH